MLWVYIKDIAVYGPIMWKQMVRLNDAFAPLEEDILKVSVTKIRQTLLKVFVLGHF